MTIKQFVFPLSLGIGFAATISACDINKSDGLVSVVSAGASDEDNDGDGFVEDGGDCDDTKETVYPGAPERCNGVDDDCDGEIDELATDHIWSDDADVDGYGAKADKAADSEEGDEPGLGDVSDTDSGVVDPELPEDTDGSDPITCEGGGTEGQVDNSDDCDDDNAAVNPAATEICNKVDDDCDGNVDNDAADAETYYTDEDGDGYGDATGSSYTACYPVTGGDRSNGLDCDDADAAVNPDATETCNAIDDDCDGDVDDDPSGSPEDLRFLFVWVSEAVGCERVRMCPEDPDTDHYASEAECLADHGGGVSIDPGELF